MNRSHFVLLIGYRKVHQRMALWTHCRMSSWSCALWHQEFTLRNILQKHLFLVEFHSMQRGQSLIPCHDIPGKPGILSSAHCHRLFSRAYSICSVHTHSHADLKVQHGCPFCCVWCSTIIGNHIGWVSFWFLCLKIVASSIDNDLGVEIVTACMLPNISFRYSFVLDAFWKNSHLFCQTILLAILVHTNAHLAVHPSIHSICSAYNWLQCFNLQASSVHIGRILEIFAGVSCMQNFPFQVRRHVGRVESWRSRICCFKFHF